MKCTNCGSKIIVISVKLSDIIEIQEKLNNQTSENRKHFTFRPMLSHWCDLASLSLLLFSMSAAFHDNNYLHSLHFFFVHPIVSLTWLFLYSYNFCLLMAFHCPCVYQCSRYWLIFPHYPLRAPESEDITTLAPPVWAAMSNLWTDRPGVSDSKSVWVWVCVYKIGLFL